MTYDDDRIVVVFTREQAELVEVLLNDPFLQEEDDEAKTVTNGARSAVSAGFNGAGRM